LTARLYHGRVIVGGAFVVLLLAYGTQYAFGVFFAALLAEFHWSRASLSGAFSLYAFVYSGFGLVAGRLTDRWGPRVVIGAGGVLLGAGLAGMSAVTALWQPYVLYGAVAALGMSTAYVPCNATVVRWFVRRRGLAVGVASAGGSVGTFVLPPVAHWLVSALGWRHAYLVFGAAIFVALTGVACVMRRDPESLGLHPDGIAAPSSVGSLGGWTVREAVRIREFWMLFSVFGLTWTPIFIPWSTWYPSRAISASRPCARRPSSPRWASRRWWAGSPWAGSPTVSVAASSSPSRSRRRSPPSWRSAGPPRCPRSSSPPCSSASHTARCP
jgi:MFS transporter, OFA family, oxalate/formate antiporter